MALTGKLSMNPQQSPKKDEYTLEETTLAKARQQSAKKEEFTLEDKTAGEPVKMRTESFYNECLRRLRTIEHLDPTKPLVPCQYYLYPIKQAHRIRCEQVVADSGLFYSTLKELHSAMHTPLTFPSLGGTTLDLHKLFVKVTGAGGVGEVEMAGKWKAIAADFDFSKFVENAHVELRKYYISLLYHYEKVYFVREDIFAVMPQGSCVRRGIMPILTCRLAGVMKGAFKLPKGTIVPGYNTEENTAADFDECEGGIEANENLYPNKKPRL